MYIKLLFNYYMVGRLLFGLALLLPLQMTGFLTASPRLLWVVLIYVFIVFIRLVTSAQKINYFDFLFDIVFVTAVVYLTFRLSSFLTLIYLFPIFFSSLVISTRRSFLFPTVAIALYATVVYIYGGRTEQGALLDPALHGFAFFVITLAGHGLKERIERQDVYIRRLEEERARMQGYERLFRVSADLAHELRNPLASISASVQFLREGSCDPELVEMLRAETERLSRLVEDFLIYSRPSEAPTDLLSVRKVIESLGLPFSDKHYTVEVIEDGLVRANRTFLEVVFMNVIKNALEAAQSRVEVTVSVRMLPDATGDTGKRVLIEVEDDGPGIPVNDRDRIFEPFVTTKPKGTGLGLAIAYRIVTGYQGLIMFDDAIRLGGARCSVILPVEE
ncbi:MAG: hypothetical protein GX423_07565 [Nitrospiraceae bacterium]|jgi:signal transduction histidine kinase|nr:hypothetical protein [Nitrospiraceae bacterium]